MHAAGERNETRVDTWHAVCCRRLQWQEDISTRVGVEVFVWGHAECLELAFQCVSSYVPALGDVLLVAHRAIELCLSLVEERWIAAKLKRACIILTFKQLLMPPFFLPPLCDCVWRGGRRCARCDLR